MKIYLPLSFFIISLIFFCCPASAEPGSNPVIFARSTENEECSLWLWTENSKPGLIQGTGGAGRFVVATSPPSVILQLPVKNKHQYFALARKLIDDSGNSKIIYLDKPNNGFSDINQLLSPDGATLIFNRVKPEEFGSDKYDAGIWRLDTGSGSPAELLWISPQKHRGIINIPTAFSPDGSLLAVQRSPFEETDIGDTLVIDINSGTVKKTFRQARLEAWSPDGEMMLVSRIEKMSGRRLLYHGNGDNDKWKLLTPEGSSDGEPAFSPDGGRIVVHARDENGYSLGLWEIDVISGTRKILTPNGSAPRWSADGSNIYFRRRDDSTEWVSEIWIINNGGEPVRALENADNFRLLSTGAGSDEGGI